ncbi:ATP-binding protein [Streptomyces sp. UH6]|uniref:ATP-binding protein n=1 Tax=Streptomyces sp. UH6 TaxID=2748379 RepID=UPI0015D49A73|nr:ATP-binding protein [Streptomyces sp. UH6]NYV75868.1 ATP-binding protein [Streptomyces sp. UH6]
MTGPTVDRRFRFQLPAHPSSPALARRLARARLARWRVQGDACDTTLLVVSELVTNAVVHTYGHGVVCELRPVSGALRVTVCDEGCAAEEIQVRQPDTERENGRGLLLVDALCRAWGARRQDAGMLVWAEIAHLDLGWGAPHEPEDESDGEGEKDNRAAALPGADGTGTGAEWV